MEYIMNLHGRWKIQSKSRGANLANDDEGAKSADIYFRIRTGCGDETTKEPAFLSCSEV